MLPQQIPSDAPIVGYKGFHCDFTGRKGFQYEIGKTYSCECDVVMCFNGFHFCEFPDQVERHFPKRDGNRFAIVEAWGDVERREHKSVAQYLRVVRECTFDEMRADFIERTTDDQCIQLDTCDIYIVRGVKHRDGDLPAVVESNGGQEWWFEGKRHREGGLPAIKRANGSKEWWVDEKHHREDDLPAVE